MRPGSTIELHAAVATAFRGKLRLEVPSVWGTIKQTEPASWDVLRSNDVSLVEWRADGVR